MALQPFNRAAGSTQVLRFVGTVDVGNALATFPKANGELTTGGAVGDPRGVRFLLADATDLTDTQRRLPAFVYDDAVPAGEAPHESVPEPAGTALIINVGEETITDRTWVQNLYVDVKVLSGNVVSVSTQSCVVVIDTLTGGLGLGTGLPVLIIPFVLSGQAVDAITVDIMIEVRQTSSR